MAQGTPSSDSILSAIDQDCSIDPALACAVEVVIAGVPTRLTYRAENLSAEQLLGSQVEVELGRRKATGWVVDVLSLELAEQKFLEQRGKTKAKSKETQLGFFEHTSPTNALKPILGHQAAFQPQQLRLFEWMAEYYGVSLVDVIDNAVPRISTARQLQTVTIASVERVEEELAHITKKAPLQARVLEALLAAGGSLPVVELTSLGSGVRSALKSLGTKGLVTSDTVDSFKRAQLRPVDDSKIPMYSGVVPSKLTDSQQNAVTEIAERLDSKTFHPLLLMGVTGSGKTEVYIRAIKKVLADGGSALLIVPEISLTPQLVDQLEARLDSPLALLHSQVGATARWSAWEALLKGECRVAVGARSAIFAPMQDLRLVIVDEEHESSYKQSDGLRYHGRDVAVMRAKYANCTILLGSATPSLESLLNVTRKRYELIELPERVTKRPLPKIEIVDLNRVKRKDMPSENMSPQLYHATRDALAAGEQVVILYNKRGFSSYLQCTSCSEVISCPECSVALTYHKGKSKLLCHYCGITITPPTHCPVCRDPSTTAIERTSDGKPLASESKIEKIGQLVYRGSGTERVIEELADLFPQATIVRMDRDTVGKKDAYREILGSMRSGEADILVGTQMIAKGHDLPGVTLVGIIDADIGLHFPDFRTSERTFQLITQAAGRAGRGALTGRVLVQTREADHPTIVATATGRFKAFARYQIEQRKSLGYPPVGRLVRLIISSSDKREAKDAAHETRAVIETISKAIRKEVDASMSVLGPAPAPHERLRGRYRWHVLVKSPSAASISRLASTLYKWRSTQKQFKDFRLSIDVDPIEML